MLGGLCVLVGDGDCGGRPAQQVEAILRGGAQTIVYRGKQKDAVRELRDLCRAASARLVLEDVALAKELDADGAYLEEGTKKADIAAARAALGDGKSMGLAVRNAEQAQ
ncbi:MAG: thiamine phosphate synthase, partial [Deltaproteobacteria bacterium]|nr:thiamine phosphate synthase [Deltaproteobacteria bacterium]